MSGRQAWWALVVGGAVSVLVGCSSSRAPRPGQRVTCHCTYLTDFDDLARVDVDVCVGEGCETSKEASVCAMQSAHNSIDRCDCQPPAGPCDPAAPGACVNR